MEIDMNSYLASLLRETTSAMVDCRTKRHQAAETVLEGYTGGQYYAEMYTEDGKVEAYLQTLNLLIGSLADDSAAKRRLIRLHRVLSWFYRDIIKTTMRRYSGDYALTILELSNQALDVIKSYTWSMNTAAYLLSEDKDTTTYSLCPTCNGYRSFGDKHSPNGYRTLHIACGEYWLCNNCHKIHTNQQLVKIEDDLQQAESRLIELNSMKKSEVEDAVIEFNASLKPGFYNRRVNARGTKDSMVYSLIRAEFPSVYERKNYA